MIGTFSWAQILPLKETFRAGAVDRRMWRERTESNDTLHVAIAPRWLSAIRRISFRQPRSDSEWREYSLTLELITWLFFSLIVIIIVWNLLFDLNSKNSVLFKSLIYILMLIQLNKWQCLIVMDSGNSFRDRKSYCYCLEFISSTKGWRRKISRSIASYIHNWFFFTLFFII